jgi:hypothetical protein
MKKCTCKKTFKTEGAEFVLNSEYRYDLVPVTYWYPQLIRIYIDPFSFVNMSHTEFTEYFNPAAWKYVCRFVYG